MGKIYVSSGAKTTCVLLLRNEILHNILSTFKFQNPEKNKKSVEIVLKHESQFSSQLSHPPPEVRTLLCDTFPRRAEFKHL